MGIPAGIEPAKLFFLVGLAGAALFVLVQAWRSRSAGAGHSGADGARNLPSRIESVFTVRTSPGHAEDAAAALEAKMQEFERLLKRGQQQIERLESLLRRASVLNGGPKRPHETSREQPKSPATHAEFDGATAGSAVGARRRVRNQAEIYTLAEEGWSAEEIAARVGAPRGEIELILGLRDSRAKEANELA